MNFLELTRVEFSSTETIGVLTLDHKIFGVILEPPKNDNKKNVSCIPIGRYKCKIYNSEKYKCSCIALFDVPGREYIAVHYGNYASDTKGCLIIGNYVGSIEGKRAVKNSKATLKALISGIDCECILTIREAL